MSVDLSKKYKGSVFEFDDNKGYGQIKYNDKGSQYIWVDYRDILNDSKTLRTGQRVSFELKKVKKDTYHAKNVKIIKNVILYYGEICNYNGVNGNIKYLDKSKRKSIKFNKKQLKQCINKQGKWSNVKNGEKVVFEIVNGLVFNIKRDFLFEKRLIKAQKDLEYKLKKAEKLNNKKIVNKKEKNEVAKKWNIDRNEGRKFVMKLFYKVFKNNDSMKINDLMKLIKKEYKINHMNNHKDKNVFVFKRIGKDGNEGKRNIDTYIKYEFGGFINFIHNWEKFKIVLNRIEKCSKKDNNNDINMKNTDDGEIKTESKENDNDINININKKQNKKSFANIIGQKRKSQSPNNNNNKSDKAKNNNNSDNDNNHNKNENMEGFKKKKKRRKKNKKK